MKIIKKVKKPDQKKSDTGNLTGLEKARAARDANRKAALEAGIEIKRRNPREIWEEDKTSIRKSVNAKCFDCNGEELYKNRTRYCNVFDCPLWHVRPYSKGITKKDCLEYKEFSKDED